MLCGLCHLEKTKEFTLEQKEVPDFCALCKKELADNNQDRHKPRWQWEMESGTLLCKSCYQKKDADYNKKLNFCAICNCKLGMFHYHPKPAWQIDGNLCRKCWDRQNNKNNNNNTNGERWKRSRMFERHKCDKCERKFRKIEELMQHQQLAHEQRLYVCNQCNASFEGMEQMRDHSKKFHSYRKRMWKEKKRIRQL